MKRKWQTMIADEGHDYLRGGGISPWPYKIGIDCKVKPTPRSSLPELPSSLKSVRYRGHDKVRRQRKNSPNLGEGIHKCRIGRVGETVEIWRVCGTGCQAQQESIRKAVKDKLALFMIRRDENCRSRDNPSWSITLSNARSMKTPWCPPKTAKNSNTVRISTENSSATPIRARTPGMTTWDVLAGVTVLFNGRVWKKTIIRDVISRTISLSRKLSGRFVHGNSSKSSNKPRRLRMGLSYLCSEVFFFGGIVYEGGQTQLKPWRDMQICELLSLNHSIIWL